MFSKSLLSAQRAVVSRSMVNTAQRGIYAPGTEPAVFINEHSKVICQGMTGKHVSSEATFSTVSLGHFPH